MIHEINVSKFCNEDFSKIENYDKAISDPTQTWHCHHRLETHDENGEKLIKNILKKELIKRGLYYNRPAKELIFLTEKEHASLHQAGRTLSGETKKLLSERTTNQWKEHPLTEEQHRIMSEKQHKLKFYTNGIINLRAESCPEGFYEGVTRKTNKGTTTGMKWYTNGKIEIMRVPGTQPEGFVEGLLKTHYAYQRKNLHWFNNGTTQTFCEECPEGFVPGQLPCSEERKKELSSRLKELMKTPKYRKMIGDANRNKRRYTNGTINITLDINEPCPEGFWRGQTRNNKKQKSTKMELF